MKTGATRAARARDPPGDIFSRAREQVEIDDDDDDDGGNNDKDEDEEGGWVAGLQHHRTVRATRV